jgi:Protein of unknown function (DUF3313)
MRKDSKATASLLSALLAALLVAGCAQTVAPAPNIVQRAEGETPAPPPPSGFLGSDYALLQPATQGSDQQAMLRYVNPSANWSSYNQIMVVPVTFWAADDTKVSEHDQQVLCDYFYVTLVQYLSKNFTIVDGPGPGVMKLSVALTDASAAVPGLRTVSVVVPQARALSMIKKVATGTYAFVGSAQGDAKLTDSVSGALLAAWSDKRMGGTSVKNADVFQWGDAENAMNYWANGLDQRLVSMGAGNQPSPAAAAN